MPEFSVHSTVLLRRPREQVFDFFSRAENLNLLTPPWLHFTILTHPPIEMGLGTCISYRIRIRGIPVRWVSEITEWEPPCRFTDTQARGPYRRWAHRHVFEETAEGTLVTDDVSYRVPAALWSIACSWPGNCAGFSTTGRQSWLRFFRRAAPHGKGATEM